MHIDTNQALKHTHVHTLPPVLLFCCILMHIIMYSHNIEAMTEAIKRNEMDPMDQNKTEILVLLWLFGSVAISGVKTKCE